MGRADTQPAPQLCSGLSACRESRGCPRLCSPPAMAPPAPTVPRAISSRLAESGPGGQSRLLPILPSSWEEGMHQGF